MGLYLGIFWINISRLPEKSKIKEIKVLPSITLVIPAYNEESIIARTIRSVLNLDYDKNKMKLIVVNDGSRDRTKKVVERMFELYKKKRGRFKTILINKKNAGKAAAINTALARTSDELFGVVDADSILEKDSLKKLVHYFSDLKLGAVINPIYVPSPRTFFEKLQRFEYILTSFVRKLMSRINTLYVTPGVLSVYRTGVLKKLGGFDEKTITEDLEIALRLHYNKYKIIIEPETKSYTYVPKDLKEFWRQRIRWYRGFIRNNYKYKRMFLNKRYGLMGTFQTPVNVIAVFIAWASFLMFGYHFINFLYKEIIRVITLKSDIFFVTFPTFKEFLLGLDLRIIFPVVASVFFVLYLFNKAHVYGKERWKFHFTTLIYLFIYPFFISLQWTWALVLEVLGIRKKW
jgi:cellulose synthase/poly-beta-1,6-N-acetylglucosamine synthase-like glycosyltransferase